MGIPALSCVNLPFDGAPADPTAAWATQPWQHRRVLTLKPTTFTSMVGGVAHGGNQMCTICEAPQPAGQGQGTQLSEKGLLMVLQTTVGGASWDFSWE